MIDRNDIKLVIIFVMLGFIIGPRVFPTGDPSLASASVASAIDVSETVVNRIDPFATTSLIAKSAIVYDLAERRTLYAKDAEIPRPLASLTKMMTAYVAREHADIQAEVRVDADDMKYEGLSDLRTNEKWTLKDILSLTLVSSSNKGAGAIAASVGGSMNPGMTDRKAMREKFVEAMNATAKSLRLNSMHFNDPTGLDFGQDLGGEGSARDVAMLFSRILEKYPDFLEITSLSGVTVVSKNGITHTVKNTNELASGTAGLIGGKTGYTELAGGNLAMLVDVGLAHPVVVVVLGSTREGRFSDMKQLIDAAREATSSKQ
jgi:D-alanyl-D-alanine carboxypeptidase